MTAHDGGTAAECSRFHPLLLRPLCGEIIVMTSSRRGKVVPQILSTRLAYEQLSTEFRLARPGDRLCRGEILDSKVFSRLFFGADQMSNSTSRSKAARGGVPAHRAALLSLGLVWKSGHFQITASACTPLAAYLCAEHRQLRSHWVFHGSLGICAATGRCPLVPARAGLRDAPTPGLLDPMAAPASGAGITRASPSARVIRNGVLEVRFAGRPGTARKGAFPVADLYQVAEQVAGLVAA